MEIKIGEPISHELAKILRSRTSLKEREELSKEWDLHYNTLKNRLKMNKRTPVMNQSDVNMITELCRMAFRNNSKVLAASHNYELTLKNIV